MAFSMLEKKIQEQSKKYYSEGSQDVSDDEFDEMIDSLKKSNPESEVLKTGWGYSPNCTKGKIKRNHVYGEIGSLDKIHNWSEMKSDLKHTRTVTSLKLDGLSVVLYYNSGYLDFALTRGDGTTGIDITDKVRRILGAFSYITSESDFTGGIRGEILMSEKNFSKYLESHPDGKNPRNAVAGIIGSNEIVPELDLLDIVVYKVVGCKYNSFNSYEDMLEFLYSNFDDYVVPYCSTTFQSYEDLNNATANLRDKWYGNYPADGLVICDDKLIRRVDSNNETVYEFNSQAFKFPAETKVTEVEDVIWELSKHSVMVPRVKVKPVELSGTTVQYCAAFNAEYIYKNSLGLGAYVSMCKSGEIIPDIQNVVVPSEFCVLPDICPRCNSKLDWDGVNLVCKNPECCHKHRTDLLIWMSTLAPRDGLGDKLRDKFIDDIFYDRLTVEQLMETKDNIYELLKSYPYRGKQFQVFESSIHSVFEDKVDLKTALVALNIPRLSDKTAEKLADQGLQYVIFIVENMMAGLPESNWLPELCKRIGEANGISIAKNVRKFTRIRYLFDRMSKQNETAKSKDMTSVAITGKLSCKRSDFEKELAANGFKCGSITKDTKFLITDDPNSSSEKNNKADKLGITKISEQDFRKQFMTD